MLGLLAIGVTAIYSASYFREDASLQILWKKQIYWICIGMILYIGFSLTNYRVLIFVAFPMYIIALGLLIFLKFGPSPQIVKIINGARSWLKITDGFSFQPSQVAIFSGILLIATIITIIPRKYRIFSKYPILLIGLIGMVVVIPFFMVLKEPDIGSASVWGPVALMMLVGGGIPFRYIFTLIICVLTILPLVYFFALKDYQKKRIEIWIDMIQEKKVNTRDDAYAINNSLIAIGSAGFQGKGFLADKTLNKLKFIPEDVAISDYIFAVFAEEHGYRGTSIFILTFAALLIQILFIAFYSRDLLGVIICVGITALFLGHIFQNIGMNLLLVPITGIPLPLISYGGTFVCIIMSMLGIVQSIWVHRN